jgi:hypothetical protein
LSRYRPRQLARYMVRNPFALEKMEYKAESRVVVYRSKMHASLKRNFQIMPGAQWLKLLIRHIPDPGEHLVRYYGWYSNRARGERKRQALAAESENAVTAMLDEAVLVDPQFVKAARGNWAQLIRKVYEADPLVCPNCGAEMRFLAVIEEELVIERILRHIKAWNPRPPLRAPPLEEEWPVGRRVARWRPNPHHLRTVIGDRLRQGQRVAVTPGSDDQR